MADRSLNLSPQQDSTVHLRLYVAGNAPNSVRAQTNLARICREYSAEHVTVEIVDVWQDSQRALADGVFATPMLKRIHPGPEVTILGDLRDPASVIAVLGLDRKGQ